VSPLLNCQKDSSGYQLRDFYRAPINIHYHTLRQSPSKARPGRAVPFTCCLAHDRVCNIHDRPGVAIIVTQNPSAQGMTAGVAGTNVSLGRASSLKEVRPEGPFLAGLHYGR